MRATKPQRIFSAGDYSDAVESLSGGRSFASSVADLSALPPPRTRTRTPRTTKTNPPVRLNRRNYRRCPGLVEVSFGLPEPGVPHPSLIQDTLTRFVTRLPRESQLPIDRPSSPPLPLVQSTLNHFMVAKLPPPSPRFANSTPPTDGGEWTATRGAKRPRSGRSSSSEPVPPMPADEELARDGLDEGTPPPRPDMIIPAAVLAESNGLRGKRLKVYLERYNRAMYESLSNEPLYRAMRMEDGPQIISHARWIASAIWLKHRPPDLPLLEWAELVLLQLCSDEAIVNSATLTWEAVTRLVVENQWNATISSLMAVVHPQITLMTILSGNRTAKNMTSRQEMFLTGPMINCAVVQRSRIAEPNVPLTVIPASPAIPSRQHTSMSSLIRSLRS